MSWDFEHWDNGKVYLHNERWENFYKHVMETGYGYPHDWLHSRISLQMHTPRNSVYELPVEGDDDLKHAIASSDDRWGLIYQPFPAFVRTEYDPEGWLPSWNVWAEEVSDHSTIDPDRRITILKTGNIRKNKSNSIWISIGNTEKENNIFVSFQGKVWLMDEYKWLGLGANPPPPPPAKPKKPSPRSIFDD